MKYRKKPVVIEAIQWTGDNYEEIRKFSKGLCSLERHSNTLSIITLEGTMECKISDYIIRGVQGEFYPCKPDIFKATYELVEEGVII